MVELLKNFFLGGAFGGSLGFVVALMINMINVTNSTEEDKQLSARDVVAIMLMGFLLIGAQFAAIFPTV